jgi:hypothetical protein
MNGNNKETVMNAIYTTIIKYKEHVYCFHSCGGNCSRNETSKNKRGSSGDLRMMLDFKLLLLSRTM